MASRKRNNFGHAGSEYPYVVLIGHVGTGKSTIVEKLTYEKHRSGDSYQSVTRSSEPFWTFDGSMVICDTPGTNPEADKFKHNVQVAAALSFKPVSLILIVVKADTRMASPLARIREFAADLIEFPDAVIGALVTHMDTVSWNKQDFQSCLRDELGIDCVLFSGKHSHRKFLLDDIRATCKQTLDFKIDHENFLKLFKIGKAERKIILQIRNEVQSFKVMKEQFDEARKIYTGKDEIDLIFEFQAWMEDQVVIAQKKLAEANNFTFLGVKAEAEAGYIASMTNQMRLVLYELRVEAAGFHSEHGAGNARRCPHCNEVWIKVEGCEGDTNCGKRPSVGIDVRNSTFGVLGTYIFNWLNDNQNFKLTINKQADRKVEQKSSGSTSRIGCGRSINWSNMPIVKVPPDLAQVIKPVRMDEVPILSKDVPGASKWHDAVDHALDNAKHHLKLGKCPSVGSK